MSRPQTQNYPALVARLERELEEARKQTAEIERRSPQTPRYVARVERKLHITEDTANALQAENAALRTSLEEARQERDAARADIDVWNRGAEIARTRIGELEAALREKEAAMHELRQLLAPLIPDESWDQITRLFDVIESPPMALQPTTEPGA